MKNVSKQTNTMKWICAVLLILIFVLQFTPFWNVDGTSFSIQKYIWLEAENTTINNYLVSNVGSDYNINKLIVTALIQLVAPLFGLVFCLLKSSSIYVAISTIICGIGGVWGMLTKPAYQLGGNWILFLVVDIALVIAGIMLVVRWYKDMQ